MLKQTDKDSLTDGLRTMREMERGARAAVQSDDLRQARHFLAQLEDEARSLLTYFDTYCLPAAKEQGKEVTPPAMLSMSFGKQLGESMAAAVRDEKP